VQRIELWMSLFAGAAGGLLGVLWHGLVSSAWLDGLAVHRAAAAGRETLLQMLAGAIVRAAAGVALGALFWASWGLIALVAANWYVLGAAFGVLCWAGVALPVTASLRTNGDLPPQVLVVHAVEWLATCLAIGLACAYAWRH
jgi:hypothetical protein